MSESEDMAVPASAKPLFSKRYRNYVLGVLFLGYAMNALDRSILGILLEPIRVEFGASDTQLGLLGGIAFAIFYSTLGIPIAAIADRTNRRNVLTIAIALWSGMTAVCGMAVSFIMLLFARIGTAVGEAGGSPPSHSLIADYFPIEKRGTALSVYALAVPMGIMLGNLGGGWGNELFGWRMTFILAGLPGLFVALLVFTTVKEPPRGYSDQVMPSTASTEAPGLIEVFKLLWKRTSFRHLSLAAALHSFVWYGGSTFNAPFFIRSHAMSTGEAGTWLAIFAGVGTIGTFLGGYLADRLSARNKDRRWYLWVPGIATLVMVPFQFFGYLAPSLWVAIPTFGIMVIFASFFFGPSFAMTQALVTLRMRAVAASILLFVQTLIGLGLGPLFTGIISDILAPALGSDSLRYALVIVGLVNIWAAGHYFWGARTLRRDLSDTEALTKAGKSY